MNAVVCLALLGYCLTLRRFSKWPIEYAPFFVISSVILLLYVFAYVHYLQIGGICILITGALLFFISPLFVLQNKNNLLEKYFTPGFIISILFLTLFLLLANHLSLSQWDEFSHWGPHSKFIFINNGFIRAHDVTIHKSYPMGGALFQYLFFLANGRFSEGATYIAQCLLLMSPLSIFVYLYSWRAWKTVLIIYCIALLMLLLLHVNIGMTGSLYMDDVVGIYVGMAMIAYFNSEKNISSILYLLPIIAALTLFKQKLLPLVLLISVIILFDQMFFEKKRARKTLKLFSMATLPLFSILITNSWHHYLNVIGTKTEWQMHFSFEKLKNSLLSPPDAISHLIVTNYIHALAPVFGFIVAMTALAVFTYYFYNKKSDKIRLVVISGTLFLGLIAYLIGLLLLYLFSFDPNEGVRHASMERYLNIYYLAWSLVALFFLLDALYKKKHGFKRENIILLVLIMVLIYTLVTQYIHRQHRDMQQFRQPMIQIANAVKKITRSHDKIFTIWQNSEGLERIILVYELIPRKPNLHCTSFGKPYFSGDTWTCDILPKQFLEQLHGFDYLLLGYTDDNFWGHYQSVMPDRSQLKPLLLTSRYQAIYLLKIVENNEHVELKNVNE